jgi:hypothetical protein
MRPGGLRKAKDRPVMTVAEKAPVGIEPTNGGFAVLVEPLQSFVPVRSYVKTTV